MPCSNLTAGFFFALVKLPVIEYYYSSDIHSITFYFFSAASPALLQEAIRNSQ
jgi:hypothetical protein